MLGTRGRLALVAAALFALLMVSSCFSQGSVSTFYDAGAQDLTITGEQLATYVLYRFDTSAAGRGLTLPGAADIMSQINSPTVGQIFIIAVTAEGANPVTVTGGTGMLVKASAATVAANSTANLYFVVTGTTSGSQTITVY